MHGPGRRDPRAAGRAVSYPDLISSWDRITRRPRGRDRARRSRPSSAASRWAGSRCSRPTRSTGSPPSPTRARAVDAALRAEGPRRRTQPAAVMFFGLELALAALPELGPRNARRARAAAPGGVTLLLPEPGAALPARVRAGARAARPARAAARRASSRRSAAVQLAGAPVEREPQRRRRTPRAWRTSTEDVARGRGPDPRRRRAARHASTVVDLTSYEHDGSWRGRARGRRGARRVQAVLRCLR